MNNTNLPENQKCIILNYFIFSYFHELKVGDVFKFSPVIDGSSTSKFYSVYQKDDSVTKINATYGKSLDRMEFANDTLMEVMIFPNRQR